jgi:geranylgeranyl diphosphate synthase type II
VDGALGQALQTLPGSPPALIEAMRYSLLAPGKRLRPVLVILAAEACGGRAEGGLPAACAVEMIHTYSLIHDDLPAMDDDDLRRGLPTCHKKFGEAMAILAGDALLTLAFEQLADGYPPATAAGCTRVLACGAGAAGMVGGQVLDLAWENGGGTVRDLENIHDRKTGALFRASLQLGAWAAQGENEGGPEQMMLRALDGYGRCFGRAFQITDDLLDVDGDSQLTGKRVQKDAERGKLTYPSVQGVEDSRSLADRLCQEACEQVRPLGLAGQRLIALAQWIVARDR